MSKHSKSKAKDGAIITGIVWSVVFIGLLLLWQKLDAIRETNPPAFAGILIIISVICWFALIFLVYRRIE